jgi:cytochrome c biogenesis protein ResB
VSPEGTSLGTWLATEWIEQPQTFTVNHRTYEIGLRPRRFYKPYSIELLKFTHDVYPGTDTPKNFASRVLLHRPETGEKREVDIYMNNPLRYAGETYYQASYDPDDHGTVLQVVHNPSWLTPYFSCVLVGLGLLLQFATHLFGFTLKRRTA